MQCTACKQSNPEGAKFCGHCGAKLALRCRNCGTPVVAGAKFCIECGSPLPPGPETEEAASADRPPSGDGERRQLTVMFCDLAGSTRLAAQLDPEELQVVNREYRRVVTRWR